MVAGSVSAVSSSKFGCRGAAIEQDLPGHGLASAAAHGAQGEPVSVSERQIEKHHQRAARLRQGGDGDGAREGPISGS